MFSLTALELARIQFGFTITFHIIFPAITIGLAAFLAVLEGLFGATRHQADRISMGALIDVVVAEAHAGPRILFHEHLRDRLEPLLRRHLKETQVQAVLHAVLSRAHDWPPG